MYENSVHCYNHPMIGPLTMVELKEVKEQDKLVPTFKPIYLNENSIVTMSDVHHDNEAGDCCLILLSCGRYLLVQGKMEDIVNKFNLDGRR